MIIWEVVVVVDYDVVAIVDDVAVVVDDVAVVDDVVVVVVVVLPLLNDVMWFLFYAGYMVVDYLLWIVACY